MKDSIGKFLGNHSKYIVIYLVSIALFLLFFELSFEFNIDKLETTNFTHFVFFIIFLITLIIYFRLWYINYHFSKTLNLFIYLLISYAFILITKIGIEKCTILNFTGYIVIFSFFLFYLNTILIIINTFSSYKKEESNSYLLEDIPQKGDKEIDNEVIAKELVSQIIKLNLSEKQAFSIGINAGYGYGKTTLLKRVKHFLKSEKEVETIWLTVSQNQDETAIIKLFFGELNRVLSKHHSDSNTEINSYLNILISLADKNIFKGLQDTFSVLNSTKSYQESYDSINRLIEKTNKKIVVFIDDLDRLGEKEILETFRMIISSANFSNLIFISGFDRNHLLKETKLEPNYLEKIFNLDISLPLINHETLSNFFYEELEKALVRINYSKEKINEIKKEFEELNISNIDFNSWYFNKGINDLLGDKQKEKIEEKTFTYQKLENLLTNKRNIIRFLNEFSFNLTILKEKYLNEIDINEYILFRIFIYKFKELNYLFTLEYLSFWIDQDIFFKDNSRLIFNETKFNKNLQNKNTNFEIASILLNTIFNVNKKDNKDEKLKNSITYLKNFPKYINNNVFNESMNYIDIEINFKNKNLQDYYNREVLPNKEYNNSNLKDILVYIIDYKLINKVSDYIYVIKLYKGLFSNIVYDKEIHKLIEFGEHNFKSEIEDIYKNEMFNDFDTELFSFGYYLQKYNNYLVKGDEKLVSNFFSGVFLIDDYQNYEILNKKLIKEIQLNLLNKIDLQKIDISKFKTIIAWYFNEYQIDYSERVTFKYIDSKEIVIKFLKIRYKEVLFNFDISIPETITYNDRKNSKTEDLLFYFNYFDDDKIQKETKNQLNLTISKNSFNPNEIKTIRENYLLKCQINFYNEISQNFYKQNLTDLQKERLDKLLKVLKYGNDNNKLITQISQI